MKDTIQPVFCLAHTPTGGHNGCWFYDDCLHHVSLRKAMIDDNSNVVGRLCSPWEFDQFLSIGTTENE